jgi:hypothetical protein
LKRLSTLVSGTKLQYCFDTLYCLLKECVYVMWIEEGKHDASGGCRIIFGWPENGTMLEYVVEQR